MESVLTIENISKSYGSVRALKNVSFDVPKGSVFGILGPNGSGKTTLLAILMDILKVNEGQFSWFGNSNSQEARRKIGTLLETPNFYQYLSAERNLRINATIKQHGHDDIDRVLKIVKLHHRKESRFNTYSLGMRQRLAIANALLGNPSVLLLDEPTNGLDPEGIAEIRELISDLHQQGITIIMASHLLDEVEKVCTHVAILKQGDLLLSGDVHEVFQNDDVLELRADDLQKVASILQNSGMVKQCTIRNSNLDVIVHEGVEAHQINRYCFENGIALQQLYVRKKSLESKFMELTRTA